MKPDGCSLASLMTVLNITDLPDRQVRLHHSSPSFHSPSECRKHKLKPFVSLSTLLARLISVK